MDSKWYVRWMEVARVASTWSHDPSSQVGAIAIDNDGRILSQGYNGMARGMACTEERLNHRPTKLSLMVHAELNCILNAAHTGARLKDSTMLVYGLPICPECTKAVVQAGIKHVAMWYPPNCKQSWIDVFQVDSVPIMKECGVTYSLV